MNDFERQLSNQPLRVPPAGWRTQILAATEKIAPDPVWTWRDWFWPSPVAWGALAAIWVAAFVLGGHGEPAAARPVGDSRIAISTTAPVYAFAPHRDLSALLDTLN